MEKCTSLSTVSTTSVDVFDSEHVDNQQNSRKKDYFIDFDKYFMSFQSKIEQMEKCTSLSTVSTTSVDVFDSERVDNQLNSRKKDYFIDFDKPLLSQISNLRKNEYFEVLSRPNCTSKVLRLFEWDIFEYFSKTRWFVIPLIYLPVSFLLMFLGLYIFHSTYTMCAVLFVTGLFVWSLSEYTFHRFLFHLIEEYLPDNHICILLHFALHAVHHLLPRDPLRLVMPPALLLFFLSPFVFFSIAFIPSNCSFPLWSGIISGYLCYDMIHYSSHHFSFIDKLPHLRRMKVYHMKHHFKDSTKGFGVSTKIWDYVFGTLIV
ncbi:cytochrome b5 family heme/steroid binding domain-containing protein [Cardiosporidium cionae]|uniref:Fatty acid 2-hydroxylase n=1 Tax=Cardiosporidium cionae TaxID=476202 RepID=A0ABQ7J417_9APIC|nr:cytochrome b5 family heme/steroid binding domain-containing protein [Cardiosporidium cionae]|eukprot:KAF8817834.1 cytochrome b5 family heme/steroid binding domain-containing protein [Cardiosporidium cionae]